MKRIYFWLIFILIGYGLMELSALAAIRLLETRKIIWNQPLVFHLSEKHRAELEKLLAGDNQYLAHDASLGWTIKRGGRKDYYRANSQGIRSDHVYTSKPLNGITRIAAFGDSFTHGDTVGNQDTWEERLERLAPHIEVMNFGVPGYGLDQAFLRFRSEEREFSWHWVFIGFMSENINRGVNVFRPFFNYSTSIPLGKPRFIINNDELTLLNNPLPSLQDYRSLLDNERDVIKGIGRHDYFYRTTYGGAGFLPSLRFLNIVIAKILERLGWSGGIFNEGFYNTQSEAFIVAIRTMDAFHREVWRGGAEPVIVLFPGRYDLAEYEKSGKAAYAPLRSYLEGKGYRVVDLLAAFEMYGKGRPISDFFTQNDPHYSPLGNEIVAKFLFSYLKGARSPGS